MPNNLEEKAKAFVETLFTNGHGQKANRLVLWSDVAQKEFGGWSRAAIADKVSDFAASVLADSEKRLEEAQKSLRQIAAVASQAISRERIAKKAQTVRPNVIKREANDGQ